MQCCQSVTRPEMALGRAKASANHPHLNPMYTLLVAHTIAKTGTQNKRVPASALIPRQTCRLSSPTWAPPHSLPRSPHPRSPHTIIITTSTPATHTPHLTSITTVSPDIGLSGARGRASFRTRDILLVQRLGDSQLHLRRVLQHPWHGDGAWCVRWGQGMCA